MDSVGNLPIVLYLTKDLESWERDRIVRLAMRTALIVGLGFIAICPKSGDSLDSF